MKRLAVILTVVFIVPFFSACGEKAEEGSAPTAGSDSYKLGFFRGRTKERERGFSLGRAGLYQQCYCKF